MNYRRWLTSVFALLAFINPTISFAQCSVNPLSWLWWSNLGDAEDLTSGPGSYPQTYTYWIQSVATTYLNTDLDAGLGPNGEGEVTFFNTAMGQNGPFGSTEAWSTSETCHVWIGGRTYDSGNCNTTTQRPIKGQIRLNDSILANPSYIALGAPMTTIQHETGHIFGMGHNDSCTSFMKTSFVAGLPSSLQFWEVIWINANY